MGKAPDLTSFGDHGMIQALERHQILVCAALFDFAVLDDQNLISAFDGIKAMCDHEQCFSPDQLRNCRLDMAFIVRVNRRGSFIQDDDRRIL